MLNPMLKLFVRPLGLVLGLLLWATAALAVGPFDLPDDARRLLPAEPALIVAATSLNDLADQYVAVLAAMADDDDASRDDVLNLLEEMAPGLTEVADLDRPLVMVAGLPSPLTGGEPAFTFIVPLSAAVTDRENLPALAGFAAHAFAGDYLAVSEVADYLPAAAAPALASHLVDGVLSASLDLELLLATFGPFIEMGLASLPVRPADAPADSLPGAVTSEEAAALAAMARQVIASVERLDWSLGRDRDRLAWHTGLGVKPGSALDPGPQPAFAEALALAAALPAGADFHQVTALDQTRIFETFREYYVLTMMNSLRGLDPAQTEHYRAWIENYLGSMPIWASPSAAALRLDEMGMAAQMIIAPPDARAAVAELTAILEGISGLQIGYELTRQPDTRVAGVNFRSWTVDLDLDQFAALIPQAGPMGGPMTGPGTLEAEQLVALLGKILPVIHLGETHGRLFFSADDNTDALAAMVAAAAKRAAPPAEVAATATWAGPQAQQIITGDLLSIINWMTEWYNELDDQQLEVIMGNPIPFRGALTVTGPEYGFDLSMDLPALARLVVAIEQLEAATTSSEGHEGLDP